MKANPGLPSVEWLNGENRALRTDLAKANAEIDRLREALLTAECLIADVAQWWEGAQPHPTSGA